MVFFLISLPSSSTRAVNSRLILVSFYIINVMYFVRALSFPSGVMWFNSTSQFSPIFILSSSSFLFPFSFLFFQFLCTFPSSLSSFPFEFLFLFSLMFLICPFPLIASVFFPFFLIGFSPYYILCIPSSVFSAGSWGRQKFSFSTIRSSLCLLIEPLQGKRAN
uniref:Uncharacterized protein n=1 Tax=Cacopsylla melanoneura TaxID=428564 RepID=A0A8D8ZCY7_9HEMI